MNKEQNNINENGINEVISYFLSEEARVYFMASKPPTNNSCIISSLPHEATGHVGNVQLSSNERIFQYIKDLDDEESLMLETEEINCQK